MHFGLEKCSMGFDSIDGLPQHANSLCDSSHESRLGRFAASQWYIICCG